MILGVNGIRLVGKRSGVGRAIESVLRCMGELEHPFTEIRVYTPQPIDKDIVLPANGTNVVLNTGLSNALWEQLTLPLFHGSKSLLFCPSYVLPVVATCPTVLIHHGSYEAWPQSFSWWVLNKARAIYTMSAWRATVVSTVSELSRKDMVRFYGLKPDQINVIPEGVDTSRFRRVHDHDLLSRFRSKIFGSDVPFIVYVGKPTERRNLTNLIRAFGRLKKEKKIPHKFLLVGTGLPGNSPFRQAIVDEKLESEVVALDYVGHDDMVLIYNAAELLTYPSSYEGFGMPVLEAMACGTPVLVLEKTVPADEFAHGFAVTVKDGHVDNLMNGIESVLNNTEQRNFLAEQGPQFAAEYDWLNVTQRYLDLMIPLAV